MLNAKPTLQTSRIPRPKRRKPGLPARLLIGQKMINTTPERYTTVDTPSTPITEQLAEVRFRLLTAGCTLDHVRGAWTCPSCRTTAALRVRDGIDGATVLDCARRCLRGVILSAIGLTFLDVGPSCFRHESLT